jgi:hypothetical protein
MIGEISYVLKQISERNLDVNYVRDIKVILKLSPIPPMQ